MTTKTLPKKKARKKRSKPKSHTLGRPTLLTEENTKVAQEYIKGFENQGHVIPSIAGLASLLGVSRQTLYNWAEDENGAFFDILEQCNIEQELTLMNKGLTGVFNSNITKLALGKHGYHDKQENDITSGGKPINEWHIYPTTPKSE